MKRCIRCILPETFPNIVFDRHGICNVCLDYDRKWSQWKKMGYKESRIQLEDIIKKVKSLNRKYDCLVPYSGGKDSSYVLYLCKKVFKLKVLAFNFDNGFQTDEAIKNIRRAVDILDVDLFVYRPRWDLMKKLYSCFLLKAGECCTPCNQGFSLMANRIARLERIPLVISGFSPRTDESSPKEIYNSSLPYFLKVVKENGLQDMIRGTIYQDAEKKSSVQFILKKKLSRLLPEKIRFIYKRKYNIPVSIELPRYIEWNQKEIIDVIRKELKWEQAILGEEHSDCKINPVKCFLRQQRWGFGSKTQKLAALVRDGQMSRGTALSLICGEDREPDELLFVLQKLGLTRSNLDEIKRSYHLKYL